MSRRTAGSPIGVGRESGLRRRCAKRDISGLHGFDDKRTGGNCENSASIPSSAKSSLKNPFWSPATVCAVDNRCPIVTLGTLPDAPVEAPPRRRTAAAGEAEERGTRTHARCCQETVPRHQAVAERMPLVIREGQLSATLPASRPRTVKSRIHACSNPLPKRLDASLEQTRSGFATEAENGVRPERGSRTRTRRAGVRRPYGVRRNPPSGRNLPTKGREVAFLRNWGRSWEGSARRSRQIQPSPRGTGSQGPVTAEKDGAARRTPQRPSRTPGPPPIATREAPRHPSAR